MTPPVSDRDALAATHAQQAIEDRHALACIGGFHSSQAMAAAPVLAAAGLALIAPAATYSGLRGETLVRLMPDDGALARAIAHWLAADGVQRLLIVHDHDDGYGVPVARMCVEATTAAVRSRPVWDWDEDMAADIGDAQAVLYVGVAGSGAARLWDGLHALDARLWLLGTDGVADARLAREMGDGSGRADALLQHAPCALGVLRLRGDGARARGDRGGRRSRRGGAGAALDARPRLRARALLARRPWAHDEHRVCGARSRGRRDRLGARVTARERFRGALLGLAAGDAVGTTVEFSAPGTFAPVRDMVGGGPFSLPAGAWTDDTSMALCLAESLVERRVFDPVDQLERYLRWYREGHWSSTGTLLRHRQRDAGGAGALRAHARAVPRRRRPRRGRQRAADEARAGGAGVRLTTGGGGTVRGPECADDARRARGGGRVPVVRAAAAGGAAG